MVSKEETAWLQSVETPIKNLKTCQDLNRDALGHTPPTHPDSIANGIFDAQASWATLEVGAWNFMGEF